MKDVKGQSEEGCGEKNDQGGEESKSKSHWKDRVLPANTVHMNRFGRPGPAKRCYESRRRRRVAPGSGGGRGYESRSYALGLQFTA